jgi:Acyltransferase family
MPSQEKTPIFLISLIRLIATFLIFMYHLQGLYGDSQYSFDTIALIGFLLVSGYLSFKKENTWKWLVNRYIRILIPYWIIIPWIILANELFQYKKITTLSYIISFLGGGLFLTEPIYVISWFVTFILICYFMVFISNYFNLFGQILISITFFIIILFYYKWLAYLVIAFYIGFPDYPQASANLSNLPGIGGVRTAT